MCKVVQAWEDLIISSVEGNPINELTTRVCSLNKILNITCGLWVIALVDWFPSLLLTILYEAIIDQRYNDVNIILQVLPRGDVPGNMICLNYQTQDL